MQVANITYASHYRDLVTRTNEVIQSIVGDLISSELSHMQLLEIRIKEIERKNRFEVAFIVLAVISIMSLIIWRMNSNIYRV